MVCVWSCQKKAMVNIDGHFLTRKRGLPIPSDNSQPAALDESLVVQDKFPSLVFAGHFFHLAKAQPANKNLLLHCYPTAFFLNSSKKKRSL